MTLQLEGVHPVDSKFCTHCGHNNNGHASKCQKLLVVPVCASRFICWVFVQLIPIGGECEDCRIKDRKFVPTF